MIWNSVIAIRRSFQQNSLDQLLLKQNLISRQGIANSLSVPLKSRRKDIPVLFCCFIPCCFILPFTWFNEVLVCRSDEEWDDTTGPKPLVRPGEGHHVKRARLSQLLSNVPSVISSLRQQSNTECALTL